MALLSFSFTGQLPFSLDIIKNIFFLPSLLCSVHYNVSNVDFFLLTRLGVHCASSNHEFMFSISHFLLSVASIPVSLSGAPMKD